MIKKSDIKNYIVFLTLSIIILAGFFVYASPIPKMGSKGGSPTESLGLSRRPGRVSASIGRVHTIFSYATCFLHCISRFR